MKVKFHETIFLATEEIAGKIYEGRGLSIQTAISCLRKNIEVGEENGNHQNC